MTGYTGFSGVTEEQSGNYIALYCAGVPSADSVTFELVGGTAGEVTLDSDGLIVCRIVNTATQYIVIKATKDNITITKKFYLMDLVLETA